MITHKVAGIITAVAILCGMITVLNTGANTPLWQWPTEAFQGMAFTIGWMTRAPALLAYFLAAVVFVLITALAYWLGSWVYRKVSKMD